MSFNRLISVYFTQKKLIEKPENPTKMYVSVNFVRQICIFCYGYKLNISADVYKKTKICHDIA